MSGMIVYRGELRVHFDFQKSGNAYVFSLSNQEPQNPGVFVDFVHIEPKVALEVTGSPNGWQAQAGADYAFWHSAGPNFDLAPGRDVSGFSIVIPNQTQNPISFALASWNRSINEPGPI